MVIIYRKNGVRIMKNKMIVKFKVDKSDKVLELLVKEVDTLYGVTYVLLKSSKILGIEVDEGFTNMYAINPVNDSKVPIYINSKIKEDRVGVPLHNEEDYDYAIKHNIECKQVIEEITGKPHDNEFKKNSIVAIVYDEDNDKYLTINWHDKGGRLFIGGTIKDGETPLDCAIREIEEETGYKKIELIKEVPKINHHYYAFNKDKYFNIECTGFLFKLLDKNKGEQNLDEDEVFSVEWVDKETILKEIKDGLHHKTYEYATKDKVIITDGILVNSNNLDGMMRKEATEVMMKWLKEHN